MSSSVALPRLHGRPERIFVSVDESTGRSTISFAPKEIAVPLQLHDDPVGHQALLQARAIAAAHPGAIVVGPHFHTARRKRSRAGRR